MRFIYAAVWLLLLTAPPSSAQFFTQTPIFPKYASPCGGSPGTWNPSDKDAAITLSNGNLTASQASVTNAWRSVRTTNSGSTGKIYFEATKSASSGAIGWLVGIANSTALLNTYVGANTNGIGALASNSRAANGGTFYKNAAPTNSFQGSNVGDIYGVAHDRGNALLWIRNVSAGGAWNAGTAGTQDPGTGQGGIATTLGGQTTFIGFSGQRVSGLTDAAILNVGTTSFSGTIPSGFSAAC